MLDPKTWGDSPAAQRLAGELDRLVQADPRSGKRCVKTVGNFLSGYLVGLKALEEVSDQRIRARILREWRRAREDALANDVRRELPEGVVKGMRIVMATAYRVALSRTGRAG